MNKWISVEDRLPDNDDMVLIWPQPCYGVDLHVGQYQKHREDGPSWLSVTYEDHWGVLCDPIAVTHWMPLPEPPKDDE